MLGDFCVFHGNSTFSSCVECVWLCLSMCARTTFLHNETAFTNLWEFETNIITSTSILMELIHDLERKKKPAATTTLIWNLPNCIKWLKAHEIVFFFQCCCFLFRAHMCVLYKWWKHEIQNTRKKNNEFQLLLKLNEIKTAFSNYLPPVESFLL